MKQFLLCLFIGSLSFFAYAQNDLTFSLQKNATVTKDLLLESTEKSDKPIPVTVEMKWVKDDLLEITFISKTKVEPYTKLYFFNAENDFKNLKIGYPTAWAPKKFTKSLQKKKLQQFDEVKGATRLEKETQTMFVGDGKVTYRYTFSPQESSLLFKFKVYVSSNTPKGQKYDTKMEFESKYLPLIVKLETDCDKYRNKIEDLKKKIETVETIRANYEANRTESNYNELVAYQKERLEENVVCADLKDFTRKYNELLDNIYPPANTKRQETSGSGEDMLSLKYTSEDGEEGYPGRLEVNVEYILTAGNELQIKYHAQGNKDTVVNLTNHSYFNLSGDPSAEIYNHLLRVSSDKYVRADGDSFPTGEILSVFGTPMDFRVPTGIGDCLKSGFDQISYAGGLDHCWVVPAMTGVPTPAAQLFDQVSGRSMAVLTTMPGMHVFTPDFSARPITGKNKARYDGRNAICFETQYYPNAVWLPEFPSPVLPAGQEYSHATIFRFSTEN